MFAALAMTISMSAARGAIAPVSATSSSRWKSSKSAFGGPGEVLVEFVDNVYECLCDWVPPTRLKVRRAEREQHLACEDRWQDLTSVSPDYEAPELLAAESVIDSLIDPSLAETGYNATRGVPTLHDARCLAARLRVERD